MYKLYNYFVKLPNLKYDEIEYPFSYGDLEAMFDQPRGVLYELVASGKLDVSINVNGRMGHEFSFFNFYELMKLEILLDCNEPFLLAIQDNPNLLNHCLDEFAIQNSQNKSNDDLFNFSDFQSYVEEAFEEHTTHCSYTHVVELISHRIIRSVYKVCNLIEHHIPRAVLPCGQHSAKK